MHNSTNHNSRAHLRSHTRNAIRALALTGALLALTATTAGATLNRVAAGLAASTQTTVRIITPTSRFNRGDAGIGAAAGLAISLIAIGSALALSHRHDRAVRTTVTTTH